MVGNPERACCRYLFQPHTRPFVFPDDAQLGLGNPAVQNCHHANLRGILMTVGLTILGAHGAVQIDENYANLLLLSKETVTLTGSYGNSGCEYVDVALTGCTSNGLRSVERRVWTVCVRPGQSQWPP